MKQNALVWFTGLISKYEIRDDYNIKDLKLNLNLMHSLEEQFNITYAVYIKDNQEKNEYLNLFIANKIKDKVLFIPYGSVFDEVMIECTKIIPDFILIDYSKMRLNTAKRITKRSNHLHISQLLN